VINATYIAERLEEARTQSLAYIDLPPGEYAITAPLRLPTIANCTIRAGGVVLRKQFTGLGAAIVCDGWANVFWNGGQLIGNDTEEVFLAACKAALSRQPNDAGELNDEEVGCGWQLNESRGLHLSGLQTSAVNRGVMLVNGDDANVRGLVHFGHYSGKYETLDKDNVLVKAHKDLVRWCYGLVIRGGDRVTVENHRAFDAGGGIVAGSGGAGVGKPKELTITECRGLRLGDNGVYVSSGTSARIHGVRYQDVRFGMAAKARGSNHAITGSYATNCYGGFMLEPYGEADAFAGEIVGNHLLRVSTVPIALDDAPAGVPGKVWAVHNAMIAGNFLTDCNLAPRPSRADAKKPVQETVCVKLNRGDNLTVEANTLTNCGGAAWLQYGAAGGEPAYGLDIGRNAIAGTTPKMLRINGSLTELQPGGFRVERRPTALAT
jgi:hypothetical protein